MALASLRTNEKMWGYARGPSDSAAGAVQLYRSRVAEQYRDFTAADVELTWGKTAEMMTDAAEGAC